MKTTNKGFRKVIACPDCNGVGEILKDPGYRSRHYEKETCDTCKGSGRLVRKTNVEFTPFSEDQKVMVRK